MMEAPDPFDVHPLDLPAEQLAIGTSFTETGRRSRGARKKSRSQQNLDWREKRSPERRNRNMTLNVIPESLTDAVGINVSVDERFEDEIDLEVEPTQADYLVAATLKHSKLNSLQELDVEVPTQVTIDPPMVLLKSFRKKTEWYRNPKYQLGLLAILLVVIGATAGISVGASNKATPQATPPPVEGYSSEASMLEEVLDFDDYPAPTKRPVRVRKAI